LEENFASAAQPVAHRRFQPAYDLRGCPAEVLAAQALRAVQIVAQQLGVVVEHLLEVRHAPALIDAVTMKAAGQLVVDATLSHLFQGCCEGL
jgi:hypothetical protein